MAWELFTNEEPLRGAMNLIDVVGRVAGMDRPGPNGCTVARGPDVACVLAVDPLTSLEREWTLGGSYSEFAQVLPASSESRVGFRRLRKPGRRSVVSAMCWSMFQTKSHT